MSITQQIANAARACILHQTTNIDLVGGVDTPLQFTDADVFDPLAMHDVGVDPEEIKIREPGVYLIYGQVAFDAIAASVSQIHFLIAGNQFGGGMATPPAAGAAVTISGVMCASLNVNDEIELHASNNVGAAPGVLDAWLAIYKIADLEK